MKLKTLLVILLTASVFAQQQPAGTLQDLNGTYEKLRPAQKKLIDKWYEDYNEMMHEHDSPSDYDQLSLSTRTTFEAVSHALMTTPLTDKSGKSLGDALDLVESIETVNGKVPKAKGDLQFRMYVLLKPNALDTLKQSSQFFRDRDNTVYHHGYPINYRQDGGTPSIQFSVAKNGKHADIDVDYRSSKIPEALFNGHLTAANSDVRAGDNTQKHLQRWDGLTDWWRNLFGLTDSKEENAAIAGAASGEVPPVPRKAPDKVEDAVQDFLASWLLEQKPELAAAYWSPRSYACLEEYGPQSGKEINAGIAPYFAARDMAATNRLIGERTNLQDAVKPAQIDDPRLKLIKQRYGTMFALYQIPDGVAADFECDPERAFDDYDQSRVSGTKAKYGRYFGAVFQLKPAHGKGETLTTLWTREGKYWKIVSWDVEPEDGKPDKVPDTRHPSSVTSVSKVRTQGDAEFLHASDKFLRSWLVADNFDIATGYFSPESYACVSLYQATGEKEPKTPQQYSTYFKNVLSTIGKEVGAVPKLRDALEPVAPDHDDLKVVEHSGEDAYTVVAVPDSLVEAFSCQKRSRTHPYEAVSGDSKRKTYGRYYATLFALRTPGDHPAALTFLWSKVNDKWKIVSYEDAAP